MPIKIEDIRQRFTTKQMQDNDGSVWFVAYLNEEKIEESESRTAEIAIKKAYNKILYEYPRLKKRLSEYEVFRNRMKHFLGIRPF